MNSESLILDKKQLLQKIKRIAYEIYEKNFREERIVLAGIFPNGYSFAQILKKEIENIAPVKVTLVKIELDKNAQTQTSIEMDANIQEFKNTTIILTDDVLNTGKVLAYSLMPFLQLPLSKLQTAVIINRNHRLFPVVADYVGYSLATTIKEHIEVSLEESRFGVYLH